MAKSWKYTVYVVANGPYPEKIFNGRFFYNQTDAERELQLMDSRLKEYFHIYDATIQVNDRRLDK